MKTPDDRAKAAERRREAEQRLRAKRDAASDAPSDADVARLVHELQVHQVELEMQNEELARSRGEAEAALARYADLYDFAPVGYFTLGRDSAILEVNLAGASLLGVERARLLKRRFVTFVADADRQVIEAALASALGGAPAGRAVAVVVPTAGAPIDVELTVSAVPARDECRVVAVDVTARKQAEKRLRGAEKMAAIGRLAGGIAHDFNNMLAIIASHTDLALDVLPASDRVVRADLLQVRAAVESAAGLTRRLLAFGGGNSASARVLDANEVITSIAGMLRRFLGDDVEVVLALAGALGGVEADRGQLEHVLLDLAVNARDAMPAGGTLTLATTEVVLGAADREHCFDVAPGPYVEIIVTDTGAGMDDATRARLFEPFFTTKERASAGFGLATVYAFVAQARGDLVVDSKPGRGTTVRIYLPRAARVAPAPVDVARALGGSETILVVDDEELVCRATSRILAASGYTVLSAHSGPDALRLAEQHDGAIHLVLSDVLMPKMSGPDFVERLRLARPGIAALFMSGFHGDLAQRDPRIGDGELVDKPFDADQLRQRVRACLDRVAAKP